MSSNSQYPPVSGDTYSLPRFWRDFNENSLPEKIAVAGEITFECREKLQAGVFSLLGQGLALHVTLPQTNLELSRYHVGDKVKIQFMRENLSADGVNAISDLTLLARQKREPIYLQCGTDGLQKWADFLNKIRSYFTGKGLLEVQTPTLVQNPGMEVELEPFSVELKVGSTHKKLFLPTSPELHLKQMLAAGFTDIFEIKTVFRNGEITNLHEPEFQMLEWYRAYADLNLIREDLVGLVKAVAGEGIEVRAASMTELFSTYLGFKLSPTTSQTDLMLLCRAHDVQFSSTDDWNELFHRLMVERVEPAIDPEIPLIVYDFPPSMAALARLTPEGYADRFELFWKGAEIANAFHELNDPVEQRRRFDLEIHERASKGRTALQIDENFMRALESGLPPSGGIALGLDRLFMAIHDIKPISRARAFSVKHQLG